MAERTITVGSSAKELRMIGWRVGRIVAPESCMPDPVAVSLANVVVPVGIGQDAVTIALDRSIATLPAYVAGREARRDVVLEQLEGLPVGVPGGGWSLLLRVSDYGIVGEAMSERLEVLDMPLTCPPVFSHSNARVLFDHEHNVTDAQIRACARRGGCIGFNGVGMFLGADGPDIPRAMARHAPLWPPSPAPIGSASALISCSSKEATTGSPGPRHIAGRAATGLAATAIERSSQFLLVNPAPNDIGGC
ncbi:membrane dipeptidase [Chelatococcus sp. SYSU_G07232]|uniref:Membrane dipeptidase n=1 Tax=Chelatococcus albus TaxID=3047466 RepID=A0ABT7AKM0_9HYPH|nr:membrane dipeptidase [Chelatococcus sp. SYSU_G07232]MDJ1159921.1 membrane dipeptidase [Chelatococcus sp. SYSU_G07232]